jgi:hypothetical protein
MVTEYKSEIKKLLINDGEWQVEPDYRHWIDEETELDCLIVRTQLGHLCGYVGVPRTSKFYGVDYSDCTLKSARLRTEEELKKDTSFLNGISDPETGVELKPWPEGRLRKWAIERSQKQLICADSHCNHTPESMFRVHGGITYSRECSGHICHKTDNGDHVWWFGFDCAHAGDFQPNLYNLDFMRRHPQYKREESYRNIDYVMAECKSLAKQIREHESKNN